jgi:hypothetical protein
MVALPSIQIYRIAFGILVFNSRLGLYKLLIGIFSLQLQDFQECSQVFPCLIASRARDNKWLFGTRNSNRDSMIKIHNHWIPQKKKKKKDIWYVVFK